MKGLLTVVAALMVVTSGCGGTNPDATAPATARPIVISSTSTPGPRPVPSGPAAPVSTVLTPFATSTPGQATAVPAPSSSTSAASPNQVRIQDFSFAPPTLNVTAGAQVTWTNSGPSNHTATANDGSFDSGTIQRNATFSFTFSKTGTFAYHCSIHPTMQATITVS